MIRLLFYPLFGVLGWNAGGVVGLLVTVAILMSIDAYLSHQPEQHDDDSEDNDENNGLPNAGDERPVEEGPSLMASVGNFVGEIFGLIFLGCIGFGVVAAVLSPGSCSSGGSSYGEFRAR